MSTLAMNNLVKLEVRHRVLIMREMDYIPGFLYEYNIYVLCVPFMFLPRVLERPVYETDVYYIRYNDTFSF